MLVQNINDTFKRIDGKTPAGGVYSIIFFYDIENNPTTKDKAEIMCVIEYDENDVELRKTNLIKNTNKNK